MAAEVSTEIAEILAMPYEEKLNFASSISQPMAPPKLTKRLLRLVRNAKENKCYDLGFKQIQKKISKGLLDKGILVIAGDLTPIDNFAHIPILCEEHDIPYCYLTTKFDLGSANGTASLGMMYIKRNENYAKIFDKCYESVKKLPLPIS